MRNLSLRMRKFKFENAQIFIKIAESKIEILLSIQDHCENKVKYEIKDVRHC